MLAGKQDFPRLPFIKDALARPGPIWKVGTNAWPGEVGYRFAGQVMRKSWLRMSPESLQSLIVLFIGFAVAGSLASAYQLVTERPLSFRLLNGGAQLVTFLAIPVLTFAAPFVIMRNLIRGSRVERSRFAFVMLATVLAGFWSLMSGTVVVTAFNAFAQLFA